MIARIGILSDAVGFIPTAGRSRIMSDLQRLNTLLAAQQLTRFPAVVRASVVENPPGGRSGARPFILLRVTEEGLRKARALPSHAVLRAMPPELASLDVVLEKIPPNRQCACGN